MGRQKKLQENSTKRLSVTIDDSISNKLDEYVRVNCVVKSKLVNKILKEYFDAINKK